MSVINVLTATCDCTDGCDCNLEELHLSCARNRVEVYSTVQERPATGVAGTTYMVGTNASGYTEYVWNGLEYVNMGTAHGWTVNRAALNALGLVKLSTGEQLTRGGVIGMNSAGQILARVATREQYGVVKLGSKYAPTHTGEYCVGIGASASEATYGQLCFNLAERQPVSGGYLETPGCLRYRLKPGTNSENADYEMYVTVGGVDQLGVVKLLPTINGYTDEEIDGMRNTHAASVGLLLDKVESYVEGYVTDERLSGYFDAWADGKDLAELIYESHGGEIVLNLETSLLSDVRFVEAIRRSAAGWLEDNLGVVFSEDIREWAETAARDEAVEYWNNDIYVYIDDRVSEQVPEQVKTTVEATIANWLSIPENLSGVSTAVMKSLDEDLEQKAEETARNYSADVFNGVKPFKVNGADKTFESWVAAEITRLLTSQIDGLTARVDSIVSYLKNPSSVGKTVLWTGNEEWGDDTADKEIPISESMEEFDRLVFVTTFGSFSFYTKDLRQGTVEGKIRGAWGSKNDHVQHCTVRRKNDNLLAVQLESGSLTEVHGYRHSII